MLSFLSRADEADRAEYDLTDFLPIQPCLSTGCAIIVSVAELLRPFFSRTQFREAI